MDSKFFLHKIQNLRIFSVDLPHICAMRVLFDHQVFSWQAYGGISRYFFEIAKGMRELGHAPIFPERFYSENVYMRDFPGFKATSICPFPFKGKKWLQERLGRGPSLKALRNAAPSVFHPTYFGDYFLETILEQGTPFVITIHDMIHAKFGHGSKSYFSLDAEVAENMKLLAVHANAVIVVSENTKRDVLAYIPGLDPKKIHTIHHSNSMRALAPGTKNTLNLPDRFLLFVGQRAAYKNFSWMLEQLAQMLRDDKSLYLVCAGGPNFDREESIQMNSLGLTNKVLHPNIRTDADLAELYRRAACFIFPSNYEGFGMPVLEAFASSCPCVLNMASSLPEVGGDAALYFTEGNGEQLRKSVQMVLDDDAIRERLIRSGIERVAGFSWEKSVAAHLAVYQRVTNASGA